MRHPVLTATFILAIFGSGAALADDDCDVPMSDWQPRSAVQKMAEAKGWTVRRIKTDDGCYEIKGRDAKGHEVEAKVDPATLAILEVEIEDDEDDDEETQYDPASPPASVDGMPGTQPAPKNRLFNGTGKPSVVVQ